jgi:hypothetical protein
MFVAVYVEVTGGARGVSICVVEGVVAWGAAVCLFAWSRACRWRFLDEAEKSCRREPQDSVADLRCVA